ncbi:unnamed protein product [Chironomus riparius]|uniref:Uncharacterized protein n=1 Tax=Chironomus riparius TaxID=315576 RepID=A0A9N9S8U7_9DIPT|nr:unnamed protein product [Chironomus riparius]
MCLKSFTESIKATALITMIIITTSSANPTLFKTDLTLNDNIKGSELSGCLKTEHLDVVFFNINISGLRKLRNHLDGNTLNYSNLIVTGLYKDEYHHENEFSLSLPNVKLNIELSNNQIMKVTSVKVHGDITTKIANEALKKCVSATPNLLDKFISKKATELLENKFV